MGLCTCTGEFSGTVWSREFSFSSLAEYLVLRITPRESPTQFTEAACCQEGSVLTSYNGYSSGMPGKEVRGQDNWGAGGASCSPATLPAPHLPLTRKLLRVPSFKVSAEAHHTGMVGEIIGHLCIRYPFSPPWRTWVALKVPPL